MRRTTAARRFSVRKEQWDWFKKAATGDEAGHPRLALIVDSPWIPGQVGVCHLDYYNEPETWFEANLLGNLDPLDFATRGTSAQVESATRELLSKWRATSNGHRWIPSLGGGVSPGMPAENIRAILAGLRG
jgi:hypothetical protein